MAASPPKSKKRTEDKKLNHIMNNAQSKMKFKFNESEINAKYVAETKHIYLDQCPSLKHQLQQRSLFKLLSWQRLYQYPLLLHIYDSFHRDKLQHYLIHEKDMKLDDWVQTNKTINRLLRYIKEKKHRDDTKRIIISAVNTYSFRYCFPLRLSSCTYIIRDSIDRFVKYIEEVVALIGSVIKNPIEIRLLQIDLLMIPHHVIDTMQQQDAIPHIYDNGDEFDDTDPDDTDYDTESPKCIKQNKITDDIADIDMNLKGYNEGEGIHYTKETVSSSDSIQLKRVFEENKMDLDESRTSSIPQRKRLCIVVDGRDEVNDDIYMFEPPIYGNIPLDCVHEWYIESSAQCIMPDKKGNMITSKTAMDGWINVFSFHIEEEDDIRCYLYRTGQILRFMPSDILDLFPYLFDMKMYDNQEYVDKMNAHNAPRKRQWNECRFDKFGDK